MNIDKQTILDIMTNGIETAMEWAAVSNLQRDNEANVISFDCRDSEEPKDPWVHIDAAKIEEAINLLISGKVAIGDYILNGIKDAIEDPEMWGVSTDSDTDDAIIQVAAFGDVVFG